MFVCAYFSERILILSVIIDKTFECTKNFIYIRVYVIGVCVCMFV